jgi:hypothetical protein
LPSVSDLFIIRYRGSGISNCLFVAARAFLIAQKNGWPIINPTWANMVIGPYLRGEKDKRHYFGLFKKTGISGIAKIFYLLFLKKIKYENSTSGAQGIIVIEGLGNYFQDLIYEQSKVKFFIYGILRKEIISNFENVDFSNKIGIHIRLGDYPIERRKEINWYVEILKSIKYLRNDQYTFFVFSDGSDKELIELLYQSQVRRVFFGNAISDIIALSKCRLIIGSDSTFSGWAAYLEQTPIIFPARHFGQVLNNPKNEFVDNGDFQKLRIFLNRTL